MRARFLAAILGAGMVCVPILAAQTTATPQPSKEAPKNSQPAKKQTTTTQQKASEPAMTEDMREAIAFEHAKDVADERQARLEAQHPSVTYGEANRSADRQETPPGKPVKDPGPRKKDK